MFQFSSGEPHGKKNKKSFKKAWKKQNKKKIHVKEATTKTPCEMEAFYFSYEKEAKKPCEQETKKCPVVKLL